MHLLKRKGSFEFTRVSENLTRSGCRIPPQYKGIFFAACSTKGYALRSNEALWGGSDGAIGTALQEGSSAIKWNPSRIEEQSREALDLLSASGGCKGGEIWQKSSPINLNGVLFRSMGDFAVSVPLGSCDCTKQL
jgi:hypothetical protein